MKSETRKLQQVGHSTLMISLPKEWVRATGLSQGDQLSIQQNDDGTLGIIPLSIPQKQSVVKCIINADKCKNPNLITRLITGVYIIGHETLELFSKTGFTSEQLANIRVTIQGLTGMSIVEQDMNHVIIKNFVDPTRFPTEGLLRRIYMITSWMQEASMQALKEKRISLANEVIHMEKEVDRIYWLIVRQMLLAARDKSIQKKIGIESVLHIVGGRTIAKVLEKIGDLSEEIANEVITIINSKYKLEKPIINELEIMYKKTHDVYNESIKAFFTLDVIGANNALEHILLIYQEKQKITEKILSSFTKSLNVNNNALHFSGIDIYVSLRNITWLFSQIASYSATIAEITINRA
ncbi:PhoU domain-containing protein, partial [Thermoproteota archaeon]